MYKVRLMSLFSNLQFYRLSLRPIVLFLCLFVLKSTAGTFSGSGNGDFSYFRLAQAKNTVLELIANSPPEAIEGKVDSTSKYFMLYRKYYSGFKKAIEETYIRKQHGTAQVLGCGKHDWFLRRHGLALRISDKRELFYSVGHVERDWEGIFYRWYSRKKMVKIILTILLDNLTSLDGRKMDCPRFERDEQAWGFAGILIDQVDILGNFSNEGYSVVDLNRLRQLKVESGAVSPLYLRLEVAKKMAVKILGSGSGQRQKVRTVRNFKFARAEPRSENYGTFFAPTIYTLPKVDQFSQACSKPFQVLALYPSVEHATLEELVFLLLHEASHFMKRHQCDTSDASENHLDQVAFYILDGAIREDTALRFRLEEDEKSYPYLSFDQLTKPGREILITDKNARCEEFGGIKINYPSYSYEMFPPPFYMKSVDNFSLRTIIMPEQHDGILCRFL